MVIYKGMNSKHTTKGFTHQNFLNKNLGGFTLIELLVVIAIIGILASVVLSALNGARLKARDAKRAHDLREIQKALVMYYDDHGSYPTGYISTCSNNANTGWPIDFKNALAPYLSPLPEDPNQANATCPPGTHFNHYDFYNPITWVSTSKCSSTSTPPTIVLISYGESGGKGLIDECGYGSYLGRDSIIMN
jgi:type II secretion system protein G